MPRRPGPYAAALLVIVLGATLILLAATGWWPWQPAAILAMLLGAVFWRAVPRKHDTTPRL